MDSVNITNMDNRKNEILQFIVDGKKIPKYRWYHKLLFWKTTFDIIDDELVVNERRFGIKLLPGMNIEIKCYQHYTPDELRTNFKVVKGDTDG